MIKNPIHNFKLFTMLQEQSVKDFIEVVQKCRLAQQKFYMLRTSGNLQLAKRWEHLLDIELANIKKEIIIEDTKDSIQGTINY